jgi:hypothetical protein
MYRVPVPRAVVLSGPEYPCSTAGAMGGPVAVTVSVQPRRLSVIDSNASSTDESVGM